MLKKRKIISCLLIISLLFLNTASAFAYETPDLETCADCYVEEQMGTSDKNTISPLYTCLACYGNGITACTQEILKIESGYHGNILGIPGDCYAYFYYCKAVEVCSSCFSFIRLIPGYHACREIHQKCWKGVYDCCIMDIKI